MKAKKILSAFIAATMVLSTMCFPAFAETAEPWDGSTVNTAWYNTSDTEFTLFNAAELAGLAAIVNGTATDSEGNNIVADAFNAKTVTLANNIDLNDQEWTPIGLSASTPFRGHFDGNDKKISNLKISSGENAALFGYCYNNTIDYLCSFENVTFENVDVKGGTNSAALLGNGYRAQRHEWYGGVIHINNINVIGDVTIEGENAAAVVGSGWLGARLATDNVTVNVNENSYIKGTANAGGVFASSPHSGGEEAKIKNVSSNIDVEGNGIVGGIAAVAGWYWDNITCTGTITATTDGETTVKAGKIFGSIADNAYWPNNHAVDYCGMTNLNGDNATLTIDGKSRTQLFAPNGNWNAEFVYEDDNKIHEKSASVSIENGEAELMTWPAAMKAVAGKSATITLTLLSTSNVTKATEYGLEIPENTKLTIDLNNCTLYGNIINKGDLTIKNGTVYSYELLSAIETIGENAKLTFENIGKVKSEATALKLNGGTTIISEGVYETFDESGETKAIKVGGDYATTLTITEGTFGEDNGIYSSYKCDIEALDNGTIVITDGDFEGNLTASGTGKFDITGGTYVEDPSAVLADKYMAVYNEEISRYEIKETMAMIGEAKYLTFAEAVAAAKADDEIVLMKDNDETVSEIGESITINVGENAYAGALDVAATAEITIKGTSKDNNIVLKNKEAIDGGYTFGGWFTDKDYTVPAETHISTAVEAGTTYYQKWSYEIAFNANGAEGEMAAQVVDWNDETTLLSEIAYTRTGYTFTGWNTAADGNGTAYAADVAASTVPAGTLYAQWSINQYTLTFKETGDNKIDAVTADYDSAINVPMPTRVGYIFDGWKVGETKIAHSELPTTMPAENITYVGQWKFNPEENTYGVNGGQQYKNIADALTALEETGTVGTIAFKDNEGNDILVNVAPVTTAVTETENMGANADNVEVVDKAGVYAAKVEALALAGANDISRVDTVKYNKIENVDGKLLLNVDITPAVNYTLNGEAKTDNLTFAGTSVTVKLKVDAALNGKQVEVTKGETAVATVTVTNGTVEFTTTLGFSTYTLNVSALNNISNDDITDKINVVLKKTADTDNKYELWLESADNKRIFNFTAADFMFKYENANDAAGTNWEIKAVDGIALSKTANGVYHFNVVDGVKDYATAKTSVKLADITFNRYGTITFTVLKDEAEVRTTYLNINVPKAYNEATSTLVIDNTPDPDVATNGDTDDDAIIDGIVYDEKKVDVKINFEGLRPVENIKNVDYQDMTITITRAGAAADETKIIKLGADMDAVNDKGEYINIQDNDNATTVDYTKTNKTIVATGENQMISKYVIDTELAVNSDYIITIEGAGYRTYTYKIEKLKSNAILTFWNDAKLDGTNGSKNTMEKVMETDADAIKVTFLAGDIVSDGIIDVYDLNAVVSYWDTASENGTTTDLSLRQYDLDRDGDIDIDDVSMVIAGWNN